jgi:hypothetical protein
LPVVTHSENKLCLLVEGEEAHVSTVSVNYVNEVDTGNELTASGKEEEEESRSSTSSKSGSKKAEMAVAESLDDIPKKVEIISENNLQDACVQDLDDDEDFADCHADFDKKLTASDDLDLPEFCISPRLSHSNRSSQRSSSSSSSSEQLLSHVSSSQLSLGSTKIVNVRPFSAEAPKDEVSEC